MAQDMTPNQREYVKQQQRLKRAIARLHKQGIEVSMNVVPKMPKRVDKKALEEIKRITPQDLRDKAYRHFDAETGEIYDEPTYEDYVNKLQTEYPTLSITDALRARISELPNVKTFRERGGYVRHMDLSYKKNSLLSFFDDTTAFDEEIEERLIVSMEQIFDALDRITFYDSDEDSINASFVDLAVLIKGSALTPQEAKAMNTMSDLSGWGGYDED